MSNTNIRELPDSKIQNISGLISNIKSNDEFEEIKSKLLKENFNKNEVNEIVGVNKSLRVVMSKVKMVADTDATVLIRGETGTGKELIARCIHYYSNRKNKSLVKVNCAAIPSGLIESELFGHEKGSFTGAVFQKTGKFEIADGGTIFLDEIGDLPFESQAKLLRILQEREFERIGGTKTFNVNVRIIAATNRNLEQAVKDGVFRSDLYYRLNVFPIELPPLRERLEDINPLSNYFMNKYSKKIGKSFKCIDDENLKILSRYDWPGNIRELENVIERAVILSTGDELHINSELLCSVNILNNENNNFTKLEDVERNHIIKILGMTDWQIHGKKGAAKILDINPNTLRSRMSKLGIKRKSIPLS